MNCSCHDFCSSLPAHVVDFSSFRHELLSFCPFHGHYFVHSQPRPICSTLGFPSFVASSSKLLLFVIEVGSRVHLAVAVTGVFVQSVSTPILVVAVDKLAMYVRCPRAGVSSPPSSWAHRCSLPRSERMLSTWRVLDSVGSLVAFLFTGADVTSSLSTVVCCRSLGRYLNLSYGLWFAYRLGCFACVGFLALRFGSHGTPTMFFSQSPLLRFEGSCFTVRAVSNVYVVLKMCVPSSSGFSRSIPVANLAPAVWCTF